MSAISLESPRFSVSPPSLLEQSESPDLFVPPQSLLERYETQIDEIGEELAKVTDYRWNDFHPRLEALSSQVDALVRCLIGSSELTEVSSRIQDKLKQAEALLKSKTLLFFDQQLEAFAKEVSDKSPSQVKTDFPQYVEKMLGLKGRIRKGIKKAALNEGEKGALAKLDSKISGLFSMMTEKLQLVSQTSSQSSSSSSSSSYSTSSSSEAFSSSTSKVSGTDDGYYQQLYFKTLDAANEDITAGRLAEAVKKLNSIEIFPNKTDSPAHLRACIAFYHKRFMLTK